MEPEAEAMDLSLQVSLLLSSTFPGAQPRHVAVRDAGGRLVAGIDVMLLAGRSQSDVDRAFADARASIRRRFAKDIDIVVDEAEEAVAIQRVLMASLQSSMPGVFESVVLSSLVSSEVIARLSPLRAVDITEDQRRRAVAVCEPIIESILGDRPFVIQFAGLDRPKASRPVIMRIIKIMQPIDVPRLQIEIERAGFVAFGGMPSLIRDLDRLSRDGFVQFVRSDDGPAYSLTSKGLSALPARSGRFSSDILRALELGRRGR